MKSIFLPLKKWGQNAWGHTSIDFPIMADAAAAKYGEMMNPQFLDEEKKPSRVYEERRKNADRWARFHVDVKRREKNRSGIKKDFFSGKRKRISVGDTNERAAEIL